MHRWAVLLVLGGCQYKAPADVTSDAPADTATPTDAQFFEPCAVTQIESYGAHTCVLRADRTVRCWGNDDHFEIGMASTTPSISGLPCVPVPAEVAIDPALVIGMGDEHTCATTTTGVTCWGRNESGELGTGNSERATTPIAVPARDGAIAFAGGQAHICSLDGAGVVRCAGANTFGELGDSTTEPRVTPVAVGITASAIAGGYNHVCAIVEGGAVKCWGSNAGNQIDPTLEPFKPTPADVPGITGATELAAGFAHSCALLADGTARCWGANDDGQLGNGTKSLPSAPVMVALEDITTITAGVDHTCAISKGTVYCWGELYTAMPTAVALPGMATLISAGSYHDCAVLEDGSTWCWHWQGYGQLGNDVIENTFEMTPVQATACPE